MVRLGRAQRRPHCSPRRRAAGSGGGTDGSVGERRWAVLGATEAGRILFVVFTQRSRLVRVITARDARKRRYRRR